MIGSVSWNPGDTVTLADRIDRVRDVVYLDEEMRGLLDARGTLMLEEPAARNRGLPLRVT